MQPNTFGYRSISIVLVRMMSIKMKKLAKILFVLLLVAMVGFASFYIPLKENSIDPSSLFSAVAKVAQNAASVNFFSIKPLSFLQITAPVFDILPTSLTKSVANALDSTLKDALTKNSEPISSPAVTPLVNSIANTTYAKTPKDALVNIFCSQKIGTLRRTVTGSGVLINKDGSVLTNAHVAEWPLLAEQNPNVVCLARYGNPANGTLGIKVSFISPEWVQNYGQYINTEGAAQTGKSDFAILKLQLDKNTPLSPISIQALDHLPTVGSSVTAAAYPADILGKNGVDSSLYLETEDLTVQQIFTVGVAQDDIFETSPSKIGQRGSSGGALVDQNNQLVGTITMTSGTQALKNIRALSVDHTSSALSRYTQKTLYDISKYGSSDVIKNFNYQYQSYLYELLNGYLKQ